MEKWTAQWSLVTLAAALAALAACGDSPAQPDPDPEPVVPVEPLTLRVADGDGVADTILTTLAEPLVVELRDATGRGVPSAVITFAAVPVLTDPLALPPVGIVAPPPENVRWTGTAISDSAGRASVRLRMGVLAGPAEIVATYAPAALADTARYDVEPGMPAYITMAPQDTAVVSGFAIQFSAAVLDRFLNVSDASVTFALLDGPAVVDGTAGMVTTTATGNVWLEASAGSVSDTVRVAAVPHGTIGVGIGGGISLMNLDGAAISRVVEDGGTHAWAPGGDALVYMSGDKVWLKAPGGAAAPLIVADTTRGWQHHPRFSGDGEWVYFQTSAQGEKQEIWRVRGNGTDLQVVSPRASPDGETQPSTSPDGSKLAFTAALGDAFIRVRDLTSGAVTPDMALGSLPIWSPVADTIAFLGATHSLMLMAADGSGMRRLTPPDAYILAFDWSPDAEWIVATATHAGRPSDLLIIELRTGDIIYLPFMEGAASVGWKPGGPIQ